MQSTKLLNSTINSESVLDQVCLHLFKEKLRTDISRTFYYILTEPLTKFKKNVHIKTE